MMAKKNREHILDELPDDGIMMEWGSGDSTIWFLDNLKPDQHLISMEHDKAWFGKIMKQTKAHPKYKQHSYLVSPMEYPLEYRVKGNVSRGINTFATPYEEMPAGLSAYIYPQDYIPLHKVDVFLIDGVARAACLATAHIASKPEAVMFLHDVRDRDWYDWAILLYKYTEYTTPNLMKLKKNNGLTSENVVV